MNSRLFKNNTFRNFRFHNSPIPYVHNDYEVAIQSYISGISSEKNLKAVYQIGSIGAPGISDIDLVVVLSEGAPKVDFNKYSIKKLSRENKYLFTHEPILVQEETAKFINLLIPIYAINKIFGSEVYFDKTIDPIKTKILNLINIISLFYPREIIWPIYKKEANVRGLLCRLNLLSYLFTDIMKLKGKTEEKFSAYSNKIKKLRNDWFSLPQTKYGSLIEALHSALPLILKMISEFRNYLNENHIVEFQDTRLENYFLTPGQSIIFQKHWSTETAVSDSPRLYQKTGIIGSFLPMEFMFILANFTGINRIQDKINGSMKYPDVKFQTEYKEVLEARKRIIDKHLLNYEKNGELFMNLGIMQLRNIESRGVCAGIKKWIKRRLVNRITS